MKYHLPGVKILEAKTEVQPSLQNGCNQLQEIGENWTINGL